MLLRNLARDVRWLALLACGGLLTLIGPSGWAWAQAPAAAEKPIRMAERSGPAASSRPPLTEAQPNEHPLMPALRWAKAGLRDIENVKDYSATMVKRERIDGKLNDPEWVFVKIRNKPFSVYMYFLKPAEVKGQEVMFSDGKMWGHGTGIRKVFGTLPLDPTGPIAMKGNRYPITEIGLLNLVRRLIEVGDKDTKYGECEVKFFPEAKINDRVCTCVQIIHPVPRRNFLYHVARIFVDDEMNLPVRFEAYDWPEKEGGAPELIEEYTYLNLKLNNGFTDADFDIHNPNYGFKPRK